MRQRTPFATEEEPEDVASLDQRDQWQGAPSQVPMFAANSSSGFFQHDPYKRNIRHEVLSNDIYDSPNFFEEETNKKKNPVVINLRRVMDRIIRPFRSGHIAWTPGLVVIGLSLFLIYTLMLALLSRPVLPEPTDTDRDTDLAVQNRLLLWMANAPDELCVSARDTEAPRVAIALRKTATDTDPLVLWAPRVISTTEHSVIRIEHTPLCPDKGSGVVKLARTIDIAFHYLQTGGEQPSEIHLEDDSAYCVQHVLLTLSAKQTQQGPQQGPQPNGMICDEPIKPHPPPTMEA